MPLLKIYSDKSMPLFKEISFLPNSSFFVEPSYIDNCFIFFDPFSSSCFNEHASYLLDCPFDVVRGDAFVYTLHRDDLNLIKRIIYIRSKHLRLPGNFTYDNYIGNRILR